MTRYAALLRGINVGGNKKIAMADLRALLQGLGHTDVATLLQNGNAVFGGPDRAPEEAERRIENAIRAQLGMTVPVPDPQRRRHRRGAGRQPAGRRGYGRREDDGAVSLRGPRTPNSWRLTIRPDRRRTTSASVTV